MSVLAKPQLLERLAHGDPLKQLIVTPLIEQSQVGDASIDVRLGNEFIVTRRTNLPAVNPAYGQELEGNIGQYQERICVRYGCEFVLHPQHLVLGSTLEYIALPGDLTAQVIGRSSWGRLGLIIATATAVAPEFKGVITLELINMGQVPLVLYPGLVIAQLVILTTSGEARYQGRYDFPTGPEFSKLHRERNVAFWADKKNFE